RGSAGGGSRGRTTRAGPSAQHHSGDSDQVGAPVIAMGVGPLAQHTRIPPLDAAVETHQARALV
ncbi:MAG: hypothetical protein ACRDGS_03550, partial [Chloroflexota bacterium]